MIVIILSPCWWRGVLISGWYDVVAKNIHECIHAYTYIFRWKHEDLSKNVITFSCWQHFWRHLSCQQTLTACQQHFQHIHNAVFFVGTGIVSIFLEGFMRNVTTLIQIMPSVLTDIIAIKITKIINDRGKTFMKVRLMMQRSNLSFKDWWCVKLLAFYYCSVTPLKIHCHTNLFELAFHTTLIIVIFH